MRKDQGKNQIHLLGAACGILGIILLVQYGVIHICIRDRPIHAPFLSYWGLEPVEKVEVVQGKATLSKRGKTWILISGGEEYNPDPKRLDRFLTVLKNVRITLRDEATPLTMARYGFREEDSVWITLVSKGKALRFLVGGVGPMGSEEYCVAEEKPFIYKLSDSLSYYAFQKKEYWIGEN